MRMCEWSQGNTILFYIQLQQLHRTFTLDFTQVTFLKLYANILSLRVDFFEMIRVTLNNLCLLIILKLTRNKFEFDSDLSWTSQANVKSIQRTYYMYSFMFIHYFFKFTWNFINARSPNGDLFRQKCCPWTLSFLRLNKIKKNPEIC